MRSPSDVHHQTELVIGGEPFVGRRSDKLVVLPQDFVIKTEATGYTNTPGDRSHCPSPQGENGGRLCPYVHCRHNLWHVAGQDKPGRRWKAGELPPETNQLHFDITGGQGPRSRDSEPSANDVRMWTEDNCSLDRLERQKLLSGDGAFELREPMTHRQVAESVGDMTERQVRRVVRKFMAKLRADEDARELFELMTER